MEEARNFDAKQVWQDSGAQRVFMPMGRLEARYGGIGVPEGYAQNPSNPCSPMPSPMPRTKVPLSPNVALRLPSREADVSCAMRPEAEQKMFIAMAELEEMVVALQSQVEHLMTERSVIGQDRLKEYSAQSDERILGLEDFMGALQQQVQSFLKERDARERRQGAAAADEDCAGLGEQRIRGVEELVASLQKQVRLLLEKRDLAVHEVNNKFKQTGEALAKTETRLLAMEKRMTEDADEKLVGKQVKQLSALQGDVTRLARQLSDQKVDQEAVAAKVAAWDVDVPLLLEGLCELRTHSESRILEANVVDRFDKDLSGLRNSTETHEELILGVEERMKHMGEQMNMYKRQQDAAVQQFNVRTCHMSKNLLALTIDMKQIGSAVNGSRHSPSIREMSPPASSESSSVAPLPSLDSAFASLSSSSELNKTVIVEHSNMANIDKTDEAIENKIMPQSR